MQDTTITSANSVLTLVVPRVYPAPVRIMGYALDSAFATEDIELAEARMGVDFRMTAGRIAKPTALTISLEADSPSRNIFTFIIQATKTAREIFYMNASLSLPATGESFSFTRGVFVKGKQIPDAKGTLQPVDYVIMWESIDRSLL